MLTEELLSLSNLYRNIKEITNHAHNALRCILRVEAAINCEMLYQTLFKDECVECGEFGAYLYVITCKRVCLDCFESKSQYLPISAQVVNGRYGIDHQKIESLPHIKTLVGPYSPCRRLQSQLSRSHVLYDAESAIQAAVLHHGSLIAVEEYLHQIEAQFLVNSPLVGVWPGDRNIHIHFALSPLPWYLFSPKDQMK
jgi:hypothetical protein